MHTPNSVIEKLEDLRITVPAVDGETEFLAYKTGWNTALDQAIAIVSGHAESDSQKQSDKSAINIQHAEGTGDKLQPTEGMAEHVAEAIKGVSVIADSYCDEIASTAIAAYEEFKHG